MRTVKSTYIRLLKRMLICYHENFTNEAHILLTFYTVETAHLHEMKIKSYFFGKVLSP
jgi:hypothetical protein